MPFAQSSDEDWDEEGWIKQESKKLSEHEFQTKLAKIRPDLGLKKLRQEHGLSQVEMAATMRVSRRSYIDYEHGEKAIPSSALSYLKASFDCDLNVLFAGVKEPLSHQEGLQYAAKSSELMIELLEKYRGLGKDNRKKIIGEMLCEMSDSESLGETSIDEFVSFHTDFYPSKEERESWFD